MTRTLTSMQLALALFVMIVLMAAVIPTALGGGSRGPVIHWPPQCPPSC